MNSKYQKRAYLALYRMIDAFYKEEHNEYIADLASEMCPYTFENSHSADPAVYEDFVDCLRACFAETEKADAENAFRASVRFLEMYRDEFGFETDGCIQKMTIERYKQEFEKSIYI